MASSMPRMDPGLGRFLEPLQVDAERIHTMARAFSSIFTRLAAESADQFLPTPISESILLPLSKMSRVHGRYLAIDIGGTNLRVGFIELLGDEESSSQHGFLASPSQQQQGSRSPGQPEDKPSLRRLHEHSWPIQEQLKSENADSLFAWIGTCIASVVRKGCISFDLPKETPLPMGVTFSFPMEQESLSEAKLMSMGKGFAISSKLDLGSHLIKGYEKARAHSIDFVLPPITVAAIANDSVSTLVSFVYEVPALANQKAAMGLICGTGSNATLLLKQSKLHPSKRHKATHGPPDSATANATSETDQVRIAVNTEWSINGSAPAIRAVSLISHWDDELSQSVEYPGFQPLEYMTAGRYLGELGRIILLDYMKTALRVDVSTLPNKFLKKFEPHNTTFLSHYRPGGAQSLLAMLEGEFPTAETKVNGMAKTIPPAFCWTEQIAEALYHIAKAIETRAAAIIAAATVGLLDCAGEFPPASAQTAGPQPPLELVVGYTGGCITNFQDYLADCQAFLDDLVGHWYDGLLSAPVRVVLSPCHDGGIKGAGILVPAALASQGQLQT